MKKAKAPHFIFQFRCIKINTLNTACFVFVAHLLFIYMQSRIMNKILLVNNDLDSMGLLKQWLESKTYIVKITTSRKEVPQLMLEFKPGIIMADIMQNEVVQDLKENENTRDIPILLMSGYTNGQHNLHLKADDIIEKPFNLPLLEVKLRKLLKKAG